MLHGRVDSATIRKSAINEIMKKLHNQRSVLSRMIAALPVVATSLVISLVSAAACHHSTGLTLMQNAWADELPQELIPPDVTLSNTATTPVPSTPDASTPGIGSSSGVPAPGSRLPATGIQGKQPAPPPAGSSAKFSGFSSPPTTPPGHKGMPMPFPANSPQQQQQPQGQGSSTPQGPDPIAVVQTNKGTIAFRLFKQYAPTTVDAFVEMVNQGFYNGLIWHRVEPGFVIQGGCPNGNGSGLYIDPKTNQPRMLMLETSPSVKHNMAGVVAMARFPKNPNTASCQFYITLGPQPSLDFKYTVFGGVVSGMDVVSRIQKGDKIESIQIQQPQ